MRRAGEERGSLPKQSSSGAHAAPGFMVFIGNLPFDCSRVDINRIFGRYGKVQSISIPTFPGTVKPRGFVFVSFLYEDKARVAIGVLNGKRIDGRVVTVQATISKSRRQQNPNLQPVHFNTYQNPNAYSSVLKSTPPSRPPQQPHKDSELDTVITDEATVAFRRRNLDPPTHPNYPSQPPPKDPPLNKLNTKNWVLTAFHQNRGENPDHPSTVRLNAPQTVPGPTLSANPESGSSQGSVIPTTADPLAIAWPSRNTEIIRQPDPPLHHTHVQLSEETCSLQREFASPPLTGAVPLDTGQIHIDLSPYFNNSSYLNPHQPSENTPPNVTDDQSDHNSGTDSLLSDQEESVDHPDSEAGRELEEETADFSDERPLNSYLKS
ncbi:serine/arginine-rich splicing factor SC35-like [Magnolia sinica]|uniref:serine/arginine-rich splicing factor SC35-like n=1 Tax=Magnolia sinica TaxID=86752 RepID=UPI002658B335|nr:serine/arginine-rich splicing factor SC35-like [Magnolia sinica]